MNIESIEELDRELEAKGYDIPELNETIANLKVKLALERALKNAKIALEGEQGVMMAIIQTMRNAGVTVDGYEVSRDNVLQGVRALIP